VTHLTLAGYFNQPILNIIPLTVTHLTFGFHFNQQIEEDSIPSSVQYLEFGYWFNQSLDKIPESVKEIKICDEQYNKPINEQQIKKIVYNRVQLKKY